MVWLELLQLLQLLNQNMYRLNLFLKTIVSFKGEFKIPTVNYYAC